MPRGKKSNIFENLKAQELIEDFVKAESEAMEDLSWLGSIQLEAFLTKLSFDSHSSGFVLILCIISFTFLILRYARIQHPGSKALRIGHNRLLGSISGGGKNSGIRLCQRCVSKACDLFGIDARDLGIFDKPAEVIDEDEDNKQEQNGDEEAAARKRKVAREKQAIIDDAENKWRIDKQHEKQIFSKEREKDESRLYVNGTSALEVFKQIAVLKGMAMWVEVEYEKAKKKLGGDETTILLLSHDQQIDSSKIGNIGKIPVTEKNQMVCLLSGTLQDACEIHSAKSSGGAANRCSITFCGQTKDSGLQRANNIPSSWHELMLVWYFYQVLWFVLGEKDEDGSLKGREYGIVSKFGQSNIMNKSKQYFMNKKHVEGLDLGDARIEEKKGNDDDILWIKKDKAGSVDYWNPMYNLESGYPQNIVPADIAKIVTFDKHKHLNTRITTRYADVVQVLQLLYKLEPHLPPCNIKFDPEHLLYDESDLIFTTKAARHAAYYIILERKFNSKLLVGIEKIENLKTWDVQKAIGAFKPNGDGGGDNDGVVGDGGGDVQPQCDESTAVRKIIIFSSLNVSSKINQSKYGRSIGAPSKKVQKEIWAMEEEQILTWIEQKGRGTSTWVAKDIKVNKIESLGVEQQMIVIKTINDIISSPKHPSQKNLVISWIRFCELSGDNIEWINGKLQTI
eukprot:93685_1